jgi:hypothetical protein
MAPKPPGVVAALIRKALEYIPPERLILTSDCGFGREGFSRRIAFYKCVALVQGANLVRRELSLPEAPIPAADPRLGAADSGPSQRERSRRIDSEACGVRCGRAAAPPRQVRRRSPLLE